MRSLCTWKGPRGCESLLVLKYDGSVDVRMCCKAPSSRSCFLHSGCLASCQVGRDRWRVCAGHRRGARCIAAHRSWSEIKQFVHNVMHNVLRFCWSRKILREEVRYTGSSSQNNPRLWLEVSRPEESSQAEATLVTRLHLSSIPN